MGEPSTSSHASGTGRLPAEVAGFVGRRGALGEIGRLLGTARLVTLTGPGGVGKTRLALRAAAAAQQSFLDGARLVELAQLRDPLLLAQGVVDALDVQDRSERSPTAVLAGYLADRQLLLVLDNCEHLAEPSARLVEELLRAAPGLKVLATSRQALGLLGEHVYAVPPMRVPSSERITGAKALARFEAVKLFEQRAAAVLPGFAVDDENATAVAHLVTALDGLPLAIELAASWLRVLGVQEVLDRLTDRFALLDGRPQQARRTLRDLMDWSYGLCSPAERLLWARVSVFSGGFDLAAAEAVCSGDGIERSELLVLVAGLVDKSVLIRQQAPGGARYRLLETVREYGARQLGDGRPAEQRRHRNHFRRLAEQAEAQWFGPRQPHWFAVLRADHANLRAALEFCVTEPGEAEAGLAMVVLPREYWIASGALGEGRQWLARLLAVAGDGGAARTRAMGLDAWFAVLQGNLTEAEPLLVAHAERAGRLGDEAEAAWALQYRGAAMGFADEGFESIAVFAEAAARHRAAGDLSGLTSALFKQSFGESMVGEAGRALALSREAVAVAAAAGESLLHSYAVFAEGLATWMTGDQPAAGELLRKAIRLKEPFHDRWGLALCVELTFWSAAEAKDWDRAAYLLGCLHALWQAQGASLEESVPFMVQVHEHYAEQVRGALAPRAFRTAADRGSRLSTEQIVEDILRERDRDREQPAADDRGVRLTKREMQVAELVAQGMSNKEISAALVISLRTAENHIEHVLAKLGFSSRTQIAVWVARHAPAGPTRSARSE
ncbi:ATP-binding protein [Kitasatospora viridis]|uniref:Putative ATPase n=1 Tax=Kitasatospora viridis TaxID=281105 RepID=A0A561TSI6_9ACTN|nr:LuxR C-terminal-related transcriptional regulator [Kitasatospora viridis]TWF90086.1 putative ATPase [Kitasatospora viridis]